MIIIDFAHLCYKSVFAVLGKEAYPTKKNSNNKKISKERWEAEFKGLFIHYVFSYLKYAKKEYSNEFGSEIVIALEGKNNWRKDIYPLYKGNRVSSREKYNIDFDEYVNPSINEIIETIKNYLPYKCISVDKAEGDDIIAVLTKFKSFRNEGVLILSEDKDFKQLLKYSFVSIFKPISKEFMTYKQINVEKHKKELNMHILLGDKADNIPNIKRFSEYTDDFLKFLEKNGIYEREVSKVKELEICDHLYKKYKEEYGEDKGIFKLVKFGEVGAKKFLGESLEELKQNLSSNKVYMENFVINKKLIDMDFIPEQIKTNIVSEYLNTKTSYNMVELINFFKKYQCEAHIKDVAYF